MAIWGSNAGVAALFTMAKSLVHIYRTVFQPLLLQGVLVLLFGLPRLSLKVSNLTLSHIKKHVSGFWDEFLSGTIQLYQTQHSDLLCYPLTSHCAACHGHCWHYLEESTDL